MSTKDFNSDKTKFDANYNDMSEFQMDHLGLLGHTSPDFGRDPESMSICPLLTPSPTGVEYQTTDPLSQAMEQKIILGGGKSPSPDFNHQDEETALLATSPLASYSHPLDPIRSLALERHVTPPAVADSARISGISSQPSEKPDVTFTELDVSRPKHLTETLPENCHRRSRNSFPGEILKSSQSAISVALPENVSSAQLLRNHYQHLDENKVNDISNFICQENLRSDASGRKSPPDYSFICWNWPLIRKSCFWSIVSLMVACFCVLIGMLATVPRRCYPAHSWYQGTVFYEIFPASYQDSNADGLGDLRGIASRAVYLSRLGIRAIRLNSIYPSSHYPEAFDRVTNLTAIEKSLGDLRDFRFFVDVMHEKNISIILDLPIHPYVKSLGELRVSVRRKNVADKITNVVHNHRSHRAAENESRLQQELTKSEFTERKMYLKPYIDGGIAGLMKSTSDHLNSISQTVVEEAIEFWFQNGVDGIYLKGLENYANDPKLFQELNRWKDLKEDYREAGEDKMFMCDYKVLQAFKDEEQLVRAILTTMDLLDVYLDVSNGTSHIKAEVNRYQSNSGLFDRRDYPWIHWNIGNVDTKRLAGRVENNFGAILFQFLLPGTVSIFYGDEVGLTEIHDPYMDHHDVRYVHQLAPMKWQPNGTGFTRPDVLPWLPFAKSVRTNDIHLEILSNLTAIRRDAPSIYMNSIWKETESLSNCAFRFVDDNIIVLERSYPRRNAYVVVYNAGTDEARNDLSNIYYRGELVEDSRGRRGIYMNFNNLKLGSGEAFVVKLDK